MKLLKVLEGGSPTQEICLKCKFLLTQFIQRKQLWKAPYFLCVFSPEYCSFLRIAITTTTKKNLLSFYITPFSAFKQQLFRKKRFSKVVSSWWSLSLCTKCDPEMSLFYNFYLANINIFSSQTNVKRLEKYNNRSYQYLSVLDCGAIFN